MKTKGINTKRTYNFVLCGNKLNTTSTPTPNGKKSHKNYLSTAFKSTTTPSAAAKSTLQTQKSPEHFKSTDERSPPPETSSPKNQNCSKYFHTSPPPVTSKTLHPKCTGASSKSSPSTPACLASLQRSQPLSPPTTSASDKPSSMISNLRKNQRFSLSQKSKYQEHCSQRSEMPKASKRC